MDRFGGEPADLYALFSRAALYAALGDVRGQAEASF
ncbi:hypothetical protein JOD67_007046 [Tenggerimyces flavus]|nr:hypothetical protein [Tenggerimyces flavus]